MDSLVRSQQPLAGSHLIPPLNELLGSYRLRFASTRGDLEAICKLRFEIFNLELGEGLSESYETGRDEDAFDEQCQHLMVVHEPSGEVVGTYRMQVAESARAGAGFYSDTEFDLSGLPQDVLLQSMELGRACVALTHRSGKVLMHLWKGLMAYAAWNKRRYFFGCSSLTSQDEREGLATFAQLEHENFVHPEFRVEPRQGYRCESNSQAAAVEVKIPKLFATYLRYGAKVLGPPAIDREFGTIDYLTLLDISSFDPATLAQLQ